MITLKDGRVEQTNFDTYKVLRLNEAPAIEVHIVQNFEPPGGMGECGTSAIVPAVANAIFAASRGTLAAGSPEVITVESVGVLEPADEEFLVRVHAARVGPWDALVRSSKTVDARLGGFWRRRQERREHNRFCGPPIRVLLMAMRNTPLPRPG